MKEISSELRAIFDSGNFFMADLFAIECLDGTALRYTSADRRITGTQHRRKITINHEKVPEELFNFPVPIVVNDPLDPVFTYGSASGYDIYVTAEDGVSVLDFERSVWDPANHLLLLYVRIARLSATKDTVLYFFYGDNVDGMDLQNKERVWDRGYMGVWHFEEDPAGDWVYDSTRHDYDLNNEGSYGSDHLVDGCIGRGWRFDGDSRVWRVGMVDWSLSQFTIEGVMNCARAHTETIFADLWVSLLQNDFTFRGFFNFTEVDWLGYPIAQQNGVCGHLPTTGGVVRPGTSAYDITEFRHIVFAGTENADAKCYVDGTLADTRDAASDFKRESAASNLIEIGAGAGYTHSGVISEARISKVERSAAWIAATAASLMDNASFVTIGEPYTIDTTYEPFRIDRTKRTWKIGLATDDMEIALYPALTDTVEGLAWPEAIRRGIFDRARVSVRKAFYQRYEPDAEPCKLAVFKGRAGEIEMSGNKVTMRVESLLSLLDEQMPRNIYQAPCANMLWDDNCHLDPDAWAVSGAVGPVPTVRNFTVTGDAAAEASGFFTLGTVEFTSGAHAGISRDITYHVRDEYGTCTIHILPGLAAAPAAEDTVVLHPGCDKTAEVCKNRFSNFTRFRGCPYIPVAESAL